MRGQRLLFDIDVCQCRAMYERVHQSVWPCVSIVEYDRLLQWNDLYASESIRRRQSEPYRSVVIDARRAVDHFCFIATSGAVKY